MQPADARLHVFESAGEATRIWVKGEGFTVGKLVGRQLAKRLDLDGCSLVISRCFSARITDITCTATA